MAKTGTLDNARDFFEEITRECYSDFFNAPSSFKTAFSLSMSLFSLHEWVFTFNKLDVEKKFGKTFKNKGDLWQEVEKRVPEAGFIRDLSNASKHVTLTIKPSTSMTHIANTVIGVSYGAGGYGKGRYGGLSVVFHDSGNLIYLDDCARKLFDFWENLIDELYPNPPSSIVVSANTPSSAKS